MWRYLSLLAVVVWPSVAHGQTAITASARTSQFSNFTTQTIKNIGTTVNAIPEANATATNSAATTMAKSRAFFHSVTCSGRNSGIGLPEAEARAEDAFISFFDTTALRALAAPGANGVDIRLNYHVRYRAICTFNFSNDQCAAFLNVQWVIRNPFVSVGGAVRYVHDSSGFHNETSGIFAGHGFAQEDLVAHVPARIFFTDQSFVPKLTARVGVARADCTVLSVLSSTNSHAEITLELRNEPGAVTLPDGRDISLLGVPYIINPYVPRARSRAVRH